MKKIITMICFTVIFVFVGQTNQFIKFLTNEANNSSLFINMTSTTLLENAQIPNTHINKKSIVLKVLLVEFQDVKHRNPNYPTSLSLPAYTYNDFNNMLFSVDNYCSPNMYSPDGKNVYGSLRDYYKVMSNNNFDIEGHVLNKDLDNNNIPDWIILDQSKSYYDDDRVEEFRKESKVKAKLKGLDIETNDTTFLAIVYAGHTYRSTWKTLTPNSFFKEHEYIMGERFAAYSPYREERDDPNIGTVSHFAHIGIHAHEFGHLLGFEHHGGGLDNRYWGLMSSGCYNGPNNEGACPAPLNPYIRWMFGWITIDNIDGITTKIFEYDLIDPMVYKIKDNFSESYFMVEYRKFNSQMILGENVSDDYNSFIKNLSSKNGILIWRKRIGHFVKLLYSSGYNSSDGDSHIFPGNDGVKVISPWSDNRACKPGYYWVPNTKPSINCGLEIISVENNSCMLDLYQNDPWKSSPAMPKNLISISDSNVILEWEQNREPDLFYYKIYKMKRDTIYSPIDISYTSKFTDFNEIVDNSDTGKIFVRYKVTAIDSANKESIFSNESKVAVIRTTNIRYNSNEISNSIFILHHNYPNPFNPNTTIKYSIPNHSKVTLKVFDLLGSEVETLINKEQPQGSYDFEFHGTDLTSGIYFYRLQAGNFVETKKMVFIK